MARGSQRMRSAGRTALICAACALLAAGIAPLGSEAATTSWEFEAPSYDFGQAPAGGESTSSHEFRLTNTGGTPITLGTPRIGIPEKEVFATVQTTCRRGTVLEPAESCFWLVAFDPRTSGNQAGYLRMPAANEELPPAEVDLEGEGVGPPIEIEGERLGFGSVPATETSAAQTVTIRNLGSAPLRIYGISAAEWDYDGSTLEYASPFHLGAGSCEEGDVLTAFADCTIKVYFKPTKEGNFGSILTIADNASPTSPQSVQLEGKGSAPPPPAPPALPGAGTTPVAGASAPSGGQAESPSGVSSVPPSSSTERPHCGRGRKLKKSAGRYQCVKRMPKHHRRGRHKVP